MPSDLILRNARIATSSGVIEGDIGITDGKIVDIGAVTGSGADIDVRGQIVTPGGVDVHAHIEQVSGMGLQNADTFETATRSAAMGGTTTVISFAAQAKGQRLNDAVADDAARAERGAMIDHAFHIMVTDTGVDDFASDLTGLIDDGHRSIKVFTTYNIRLTDREILDIMALARQRALVCVHAENDAMIGFTKDRLLATGHTRPPDHATSHPRAAELEAVERMIRFAEFLAQPVMLFHLSTAEAVDAVRAARDRGVPVWAETCPHYLLMSEDALDRDGVDGAKWMCSPPQRTDDDSAALWQGLGDGTLDLVSSDHAPYRFDATGKLAAGPNPRFDQIANGLPGLETRLPLLFDAMVSRGRGNLESFVRLTSTNPAQLHGLEAKGDIAVGKDADLVIWDAVREVTFGADDLHDNVGYNPWAGRHIKGWPDTVILRGEIIVDQGALKATPGQGQWKPRRDIRAKTGASPAPELTNLLER